MSIRVVVVDDQPTIRLGLSMIVDHEDDMEVVGEAGTGRQAIDVVRETAPDVVLMDIRMPDGNGIDAVAALAADPEPRARTIMLTTFHDEEYVVASLRAGADAFLLKDAEPAELIAAIRRVHAGDSLLDPSVTRGLIARYVDLAAAADTAQARASGPSAQALLAPLTAREREVLREVATGRSNREIAQTLGMSEATVKSHIRSILAKLGLTSRVQLVIAAYQSGLVAPSESQFGVDA